MVTHRQQEILEYMAAYLTREGFPPTIREICAALGLSSPGSLMKHLQTLEKEGLITKSLGKKRAWKLILNKPAGSSIPLLGRIAAGKPILSDQNNDESLPVDPLLFGSTEVFALNVKGDSMIEAHIRDGDLAIIRPQNYAQNGEIVAVQIEDLETEATLKLFFHEEHSIELRPANANYKPRKFTGKEQERIKILGKLVGVIRPKP